MQNDLFSFQPPAKYPDAPGYSNFTTSKIAAERIEPHVSHLAGVVLAHVEAAPCTAWEIETRSDMRAQTITARLRELTLIGMIEDSGERRPTYSGRPAIVWKVRP